MTNQNPSVLVSVHGGHSGEFCNHATDSLTDIINAYIRKGFSWVGITEHMPPVNDRFLYQDEKDQGLDAEQMFNRFKQYMGKVRKLQTKYSSLIDIYAGFETETYTGTNRFIIKLVENFKPDFIIGSVHHVNDMEIDTSMDHYLRAIESSGGIDDLYCDYFDQQFEMIHTIKPRVIGHFDLVRIYDPDYKKRMEKPMIWKKILRNMEAVKEFEIIMDFNMRALYKGAPEPYISSPILQKALDLNISVVPGDDSHGLNTVGRNIEHGIGILEDLGFNTNWKKPVD